MFEMALHKQRSISLSEVACKQAAVSCALGEEATMAVLAEVRVKLGCRVFQTRSMWTCFFVLFFFHVRVRGYRKHPMCGILYVYEKMSPEPTFTKL